MTIVYATHILDGLDGWPTKLLHVSRGKVVHYGEPSDLVAHATDQTERALESGSLYRTVRSRLRSELVAEAQAAKDALASPAAMEVDAAPAKAVAAPCAPAGSRFDRFGGGGGRQMNMYG